jgi:hypothetical protein
MATGHDEVACERLRHHAPPDLPSA